jgi:RecA-family ATPase
MSKEVKIIQMSDVQSEDVRWLWYPYIPYGKITIIQGDPGDGKTTFVLALSALLTKGQSVPNTNECSVPITVIYQTAEDGLADTIKPRLEKAGADCTRVCVIDESEQGLSFADERLESAVKQLGAKLLILDPLQAYLGSEVDMFRPNEVRPLFKKLTGVAERTGCAIVII